MEKKKNVEFTRELIKTLSFVVLSAFVFALLSAGVLAPEIALAIIGGASWDVAKFLFTTLPRFVFRTSYQGVRAEES